jgi:hypothetical protein
MGHAADVCQFAPHDDSGSYGGGDSKVQACASRSVGLEPEAAQVPRGSVPARGRSAVASRIGFGAGMSQDGRRSSTRLDLKISSLQDGRRILGLRRKRANLGED